MPDTLQDQALERRVYLGGSEIAAAMGLSRWCSPLALWAEKTGKLKPDQLANSEAMEIGLELEEYVARKFEQRTGKKLRRDQRELIHPDFPFLRGHADYVVLNEEANFDAKTTSTYQLKAWEGEEIPIDYVLQQNWYLGLKRLLGLTGWKTAYLGVLIGGQKFRWKQIAFDAELFTEQVESAVKFWNEFVLTDTMPVATAGDQDLLAHLFPRSSAALVTVSDHDQPEVDQLIARRASSLRQIKAEELIVESCEAQLKQRIGETGGLVTAKYRITWSSESRQRVDIDRLRLDGLYPQYLKSTTTRILRVKALEVANG